MANKTRAKAAANTGLKALSLILAILFVVAGIVAAVGWVKVDKLKDQIATVTPSEEEPTVVGETLHSNGLAVTPISKGVVRLKPSPLTVNNEEGVTVFPDTSCTLTVDVDPEEAADNTSFDWAVAWPDETSTWASGKTVTNFLTVTPETDGAGVAIVECKQAFGEQIIVSVVCRENNELTAECVCDYTKKVDGFSMQAKQYKTNKLDFQFDASVSELRLSTSGTYCTLPLRTIAHTPTYSTYTIDDEFALSITVTINPDFLALLNSAGLTPKNTTVTDYEIMPNDNVCHTFWSGTAFFYNNVTLGSSEVDASFCGFTVAQANAAISKAKSFGANRPIYNLTINFVGTYSSFERTIPVYFTASSLTSIVTGVSLEPNLIF